MVQNCSLSIRQACKAAGLHRSGYYYTVQNPDKDRPVIKQLRRLAKKHPTHGFWKMHYRLRNKGYAWNHKRTYRVYKLLNLNIRRKHKRRLPTRVKEPLEEPVRPNEVWSMDFMSDSLRHGRRFRTLNIIDDHNRELCWLEVGMSLTAEAVTRCLDHVIGERGKPRRIRVDNGPEFTSSCFENYCRNKNIRISYIQPGKPTQNAYIERFNRTYRSEVLDAYLFSNLREVRDISYQWADDYNYERPHESLNNQPPITFAKQLLNN